METRLNVLGHSCHIVFEGEPSEQSGITERITAEFNRIDEKFSAFNPKSVVAALNQNAGTGHYLAVDAESRSLFEYITALWSESHHLFDPTTRVLQDCYDENGRPWPRRHSSRKWFHSSDGRILNFPLKVQGSVKRVC